MSRKRENTSANDYLCWLDSLADKVINQGLALTEACNLARSTGPAQCAGKHKPLLLCAVLAPSTMPHRRKFTLAILNYMVALSTSEKSTRAACADLVARSAIALGDYRLAEETFGAVLLHAESEGDLQAQAAILGNLGTVYMSQGLIEKAIRTLMRGLEKVREVEDRSTEASILAGTGNALYLKGDTVRAIEYINRSIEINRQLGDEGKVKLGTNLNDLANCQSRLGNTGEALKLYRDSLVMEQESGNMSGVCRCYGNIADQLLTLGQLDSAEQHFRQAVSTAERYSMTDAVAHWKCGLANVLFRRNDFETAEKLYRESLEYASSCGLLRNQVAARLGLAKCHLQTGSTGPAEIQLEKALSIARCMPDPEMEIAAVSLLASVYQKVASAEDALYYCKSALNIAGETKEPLPQAMLMRQSAALHADLGDYEKAIRIFSEAVAKALTHGYKDIAAESSLGLSEAYQMLHSWEASVEYTRKASALFRQLDNVRGVISCLAQEGLALDQRGEEQKAEEKFEEALELAIECNECDLARTIRVQLKGLRDTQQEGIA